jgi:hypothetical protein
MAEDKHNSNPEEPSWFEKPGNIRLINGALIATCIALALADLFYKHDDAHFVPPENWFAFNAWFGFVAFIVIVYLGRFLRFFVKRDEDYYDR